MTRTPQDAVEEEMMGALERAGVDMWQLARLSTDDGLFVVERDDLDQELAFRQSSDFLEGTHILWRWHIWGRPSLYISRARIAELSSGWEPDVASMVARVVAFLGMGKP